MQVSDFRALGTAPKLILSDTTVYTARNKNGCLLYILNNSVFATLFLRFNIGGDTFDYGGLTLAASTFLPGVKKFSLTSGVVLIIE